MVASKLNDPHSNPIRSQRKRIVDVRECSTKVGLPKIQDERIEFDWLEWLEYPLPCISTGVESRSVLVRVSELLGPSALDSQRDGHTRCGKK